MIWQTIPGFKTSLIKFVQSSVPSFSRKNPASTDFFESSSSKKDTVVDFNGSVISPYSPARIAPKFNRFGNFKVDLID